LIGYIELLRQSAVHLERRYGFAKPGGYTIVARSTIGLPRTEEPLYADTSYVQPIETSLPSFAVEDVRPGTPRSVAESIGLMRFIWAKPLRLGPVNDRGPFQLSALKRLEMLEKGEWSAQCADMRYIFVDLAANSPGISRVRYVHLFQYHPFFPDLVPNSHGAAEVYADEIEQWVLVDPWYGHLFELNGQYLSVEDIRRMPSDERRNIKVVDAVPDVDVPASSSALVESGIVLTEGYYTYFNTVQYGPDEIVDLSD